MIRWEKEELIVKHKMSNKLKIQVDIAVSSELKGLSVRCQSLVAMVPRERGLNFHE